MSRWSIKVRMTVWYTLLMAAVVAVSMSALIIIAQAVVESDARSQLIATIDGNSTEVKYEEGYLTIDGHFIFSQAGISSAIYSYQGRLLSGEMPNTFPTGVSLSEGNPRMVANGDLKYYVYDVCVTSADSPDIWVRGVVSTEGSSGFVGSIVRVAVIVVPVIVILAAIGGYLISRRSLKPIEEVTRTAAEIGEGQDLTQRIYLHPGDDEVHQLADTFNAMMDRLERSFEAEKQFTSDASHELKTPLSVILAQCDFALGHDLSADEGRESLNVIQRQATRMSTIVKQLLSFARLEQGTQKVSLQPTDLSQLVGAICDGYLPARARGITMHTDITPGVRACVDETLFARAVMNLLDNAFRYGNESGNVWVGLSSQDDKALLTVRDDGPGIPADEMQKIWGRFYQVSRTRTSDDEVSTGLGLAMVRRIAEIHQGRASVASVVGEGSTFCLEVPLLTEAELSSQSHDLS